MEKNIAIFASGQGTNADNIIKYFKGSSVFIKVIITNNPNAGVINIAVKYSIPYLVINKKEFYNEDLFLGRLEEFDINLCVLAGFLWLIPTFLINFYNNKIINIHPALLPRYGGKGMYGMNVHEAVRKSGDRMTGITIHFVNEKYDKGAIIFQAKVNILAEDSSENIANKIHKLEYKHFPVIIRDLLV